MVETITNCQEQFNNGKINMYPQLDNGMQFRLNEFNRTKGYFIDEILKREFNRLIILTKLCLFYLQHFF